MTGDTLGIVLTTYQRTDYAVATVRAIRKRLQFDGEIVWYLADDGSHPDHRAAVWRELDGACVLATHTARMGVGAGMNIGIERVLEVGNLFMTLEDDWELGRDLDITPYVDLLRTHGSIGMVRLGYLVAGSDVRTAGYDGRMYLEFLASTNYAYSGHPQIRHRRFWDAYGRYPEYFPPHLPGEVEIAFDAQVRQSLAHGPSIVWPLELGDPGPFGHIGAVKSESLA